MLAATVFGYAKAGANSLTHLMNLGQKFVYGG